MISVSVIVPIYNAGKYLKDCLNALHAQTLQDTEFILVLDCPTDGSDIVAKCHAELDSRFVIIENKENLHIGNSRNKGISIARGKFLAFCDHDDIMEPNMYETLYNEAITKKADIVISQPAYESYGKKHVIEIANLNVNNIKEQVLSSLLSSGGLDKNVSPFCNIHNNIYKRSIILDNKIQFVDTRTTTPEDVFFNIETIYYATKVRYYPDALYYHRMIEESTGHQSKYQDWTGRFNGIYYLYEWLIGNHLYSGEMKAAFHIRAQKTIISGILGTILEYKWNDFRTAYHQARQYPFTRDAMKHYLDKQPRPIHKKIIRRFFCFTLSL